MEGMDTHLRYTSGSSFTTCERRDARRGVQASRHNWWRACAPASSVPLGPALPAAVASIVGWDEGWHDGRVARQAQPVHAAAAHAGRQLSQHQHAAASRPPPHVQRARAAQTPCRTCGSSGLVSSTTFERSSCRRCTKHSASARNTVHQGATQHISMQRNASAHNTAHQQAHAGGSQSGSGPGGSMCPGCLPPRGS